VPSRRSSRSVFQSDVLSWDHQYSSAPHSAVQPRSRCGAVEPLHFQCWPMLVLDGRHPDETAISEFWWCGLGSQCESSVQTKRRRDEALNRALIQSSMGPDLFRAYCASLSRRGCEGHRLWCSLKVKPSHLTRIAMHTAAFSQCEHRANHLRRRAARVGHVVERDAGCGDRSFHKSPRRGLRPRCGTTIWRADLTSIQQK